MGGETIVASVAAAVAAVAALISWIQAKAAKRQAETADRQARSAEEQAKSAQRQVEEAKRQADAAEKAAALTEQQLDVGRAQLVDLRAERAKADNEDFIRRLGIYIDAAAIYVKAAEFVHKHSKVGLYSGEEEMFDAYEQGGHEVAVAELRIPTSALNEKMKVRMNAFRANRDTFDTNLLNALTEADRAAYSYLVTDIGNLKATLSNLRDASREIV